MPAPRSGLCCSSMPPALHWASCQCVPSTGGSGPSASIIGPPCKAGYCAGTSLLACRYGSGGHPRQVRHLLTLHYRRGCIAPHLGSFQVVPQPSVPRIPMLATCTCIGRSLPGCVVTPRPRTQAWVGPAFPRAPEGCCAPPGYRLGIAPARPVEHRERTRFDRSARPGCTPGHAVRTATLWFPPVALPTR